MILLMRSVCTHWFQIWQAGWCPVSPWSPCSPRLEHNRSSGWTSSQLLPGSSLGWCECYTGSLILQEEDEDVFHFQKHNSGPHLTCSWTHKAEDYYKLTNQVDETENYSKSPEQVGTVLFIKTVSIQRKRDNSLHVVSCMLYFLQ